MSHAPVDYFDLSTTSYASLFDGIDYVWDAIPSIASYIQLRLNKDLKPNIATIDVPSTLVYQSPDIYIGENVKIIVPLKLPESYRLGSLRHSLLQS
jgi:hypothetical protein